MKRSVRGVRHSGCALLAMSVAIVAGCAGKTVQVQRLVPGSVPIGPIRTVGVASFTAQPGYEVVASTLVGKLEQGIANSGYLKMFSRNPSELKRLVKEMEEFQGRGNLRSSDLDRLLGQGLEGIIFGEVTGGSVQDARTFEDVPFFDASINANRTVRQVYYQRRGDLTVTYRILDVRTAQVLAAQAENQTAAWEILESGDPRLASGATTGGTPAFQAGYAMGTAIGALLGGNNAAAAPPPNRPPGSPQRVTQLPAAPAIFDDLATKSVDGFLAKIQPHYDGGVIELAQSDNASATQGIEYACACDWDQAERYLKFAIDSGKDITSADYFNLGIVKEMRGCRSEALALLDQAVRREPGEAKYVHAHAALRQNQDVFSALAAGAPAPTCPKRCTIEPRCGQ